MSNPTLVVLAAGMGSRYGGLKQLDHFGPNNETIIDYAIYDAIKVGFKKVVFVIRKSIEKDFQKAYVNKWSDKIEVACVFQELDSLPSGLKVPTDREKPWGTAHAVLMAEKEVSDPFAVVNADDYYGRKSLKAMLAHLTSLTPTEDAAVLVAYILKNTLSEHGKVSRGICELKKDSLVKITERTDIYKKVHEGAYYIEKGQQHSLTGEELVSMNLMGFTPTVFKTLTDGFKPFFKEAQKNPKAEYYIPQVMQDIIESDIDVPVIKTEDNWFGVTYKEDKPDVRKKLSALIDKGFYPEDIWK